MILKLAIEQARSERRFSLWTAALLAATVGLVSFSLTALSTERAFDDLTRHASAADHDFFGYALTVVGDLPEGPDPAWVRSTAEIDTALTRAIIDGSDVIAHRSAPLNLETYGHFDFDDYEGYDSSSYDPFLSGYKELKGLMISSFRGDYDWDAILGEGKPPRQHEIALSAAIAKKLGIGVGDQVYLSVPVAEQLLRDRQEVYSPRNGFFVSGLLRSNAGLTVGAPWETDAIISWEVTNAALGLFTRTSSREGAPEPTRRMWVGPETWISYNDDHPSLAIFVDPDVSRVPTSTPQSVPLSLAAACVLVLAGVGGAFAVGRSLGQARVRWVATTRTLGATQRAIRGASLVETLLIGVVATAVGFLIGFVVSAIRLQVLRNRVPYPLAPTAVPLPWWVFAGVGGTGLVMALVLAAVPAFWASRIPPIAAHKATADLAVVETSRRVPIRWLGIPFAVGLGLILAGGDGTFGGTVLLTFGGILAIPIAFAFLIEGLRHLVPIVGRRLARSQSVWVMVSGDAISSRPRQASALATLAATVGLFGAFLCTIWVLGQHEWFLEQGGGTSRSWSEFNGGPLGGWNEVSFGFAVGLLVVIQAICLAVTLSSLRVTSAEQATRQALGLTPEAGRAAAFAQHAVPQMVGGTVGGIVGFGVAWFIHFGTDINYSNYSHHAVSEYLPAFGYSIVSSLAFATLGLAVVLAGAFFASRAAKERTPVEALRQTG